MQPKKNLTVNYIQSIIFKLKKFPYKYFWFYIFLYCLIAGFIFQLYVLPTLFTKMHAGNGLIINGDWVGYHEIAKNLAERVHENGWNFWELRPYGQSAAGIAAVIYALTISKPFALLPLYAAIMASSALILMKITESLVHDRFLAFVSVIPFAIFPSNVVIYYQIGKDAIYFLGAYICIYSWILIFKDNSSIRIYFKSIAYLTIGSFLMFIVRNYSLVVLKNMTLIWVLIMLSMLFYSIAIKSNIRNKILSLLTLLMSLGIFMIYPIDKSDPRGLLSSTSTFSQQKTIQYAIPEIKNEDWHGLIFARDVWKRSTWLPSKLDDALLNIAILRNGYLADFSNRGEIYRHTGSMIDVDISITSAFDFINYMPRAIQVGMLSPFPNLWFRGLNSAGGQGGIQQVIAIEMLFTYFCLLMLPIAILGHWKTPYFYVTAIFSIIMLLLYAFSTPNIGTLYRLRYGFIMPFITISFGCGISQLINKFQLRQ